MDVRIISATNCDLAQAVAAGRFRPDLYYRLRVLPLQLPELCSRGDDVKLLVDYFLRVKGERLGNPTRRFSAEAMRCIVDYPWPGNVRELRNAIERAMLLADRDQLVPEDFSTLSRATPGATFKLPAEGVSLDEIERQLAAKGWRLTHILNTHHHADHAGGNLALKRLTGCTIVGPRADAARIPGIDVAVGEGDAVARVADPVHEPQRRAGEDAAGYALYTLAR